MKLFRAVLYVVLTDYSDDFHWAVVVVDVLYCVRCFIFCILNSCRSDALLSNYGYRVG